MEFLPLFFSLREAPVLLVGGGQVGLRKARLLTRAGAVVTVVAPEIEPELQALLESANGEWREGRYHPDDLAGQRLVVAATPYRAVNEAVADLFGERIHALSITTLTPQRWSERRGEDREPGPRVPD